MATKVLIVEDDKLVRRLYTDIFTLEKFRVSTAENGEEAIRLARKIRPNAIVLDVMMPKMSGLDVLKYLKKSEQTSDIPVIMLTNLDDDAVKQEALDNGAERYLIKSAHSHRMVITAVQDSIYKPRKKRVM